MSELDQEREAQSMAQRDVESQKNDVANDEVKEYISRLNKDDEKRRLKMQREKEEMLRQIEERDRQIAELAARDAERAKAFETVSKIAEKLDSRAIAQQLKREAELEGLVDFDLLAFVDRSSVKVTDEGDVIGAKEAILKLKERKSFAFKKPMTTIRTESDLPPELSDLLQPAGDSPKMMTQSEFMASLGIQDAF